MSLELKEQYQIDILADEAGGYVSPPTQEGLEYTDLFSAFAVSLASAITEQRQRRSAS